MSVIEEEYPEESSIVKELDTSNTSFVKSSPSKLPPFVIGENPDPDTTNTSFVKSSPSELLPFIISEETEPDTSSSSFVKSSPLELPPCKVCNGRASGIHYGVNSCEACKGFFRRFLSRKEPYVCSKDKNCEITDRPRGNCSACRMQRCLDLGMSKEAVRQGRYTLEERTKTINAVRLLQGKDTTDMEVGDYKPNTDCHDLVSSVTGNFPMKQEDGSEQYSLTDDSKTTLNIGSLSIQGNSTSPGALRTSDGWNSMSLPSSPWSSNSSIHHSIVDNSEKDSKLQTVLDSLHFAYDQFSYPSRKLNEEQMQQKFKEAWERHTAMQELLGPMKHLKPEEFQAVFDATGLDVDGRQNWMLKHKEVWEEIVTQYVQFAKAIPGFTSLVMNDQSTLLKVARFEFFMLLEHNCINPDLEVMVEHTGQAIHLDEICYYAPRDMMKNWFEFSRRIKDFKFIKEEMVLVLAICLTFRDRAELEQPEQVEALQLTLIGYLRQLLRRHHGDREHMIFTKIMDLFVAFRKLNNEFLNSFQEMCDDKIVKQTIPEMLEFLF